MNGAMNYDPADEGNLVLFVGEGDFSFSYNYILLNQKDEVKDKVFATCLSSEHLTENQKANIDKILSHGGTVYTDVDATELHSHSNIKDHKFKKVVFNFPHIRGKMNIKKNRYLVQQFLISAEKILSDDGSVWVTLCQGQGGTELEKCVRKYCDTWQISSLAAHASLVLSCIKPFDEQQLGSYNCTGFRGQEKAFKTEGALIHIFKRPRFIDNLFINFDYVNSVDFESLSETIKKLQVRICKQSFPCSRIQSELKNWSEISVSHVKTDLLVCKSFSTMPLISCPPDSKSINFCNNCLKHMYAPYFADCHDIIFVAHNVCCIKNITLNFRPLSHVVSYLSGKSEVIFMSLTKLLAFLNSASFMPTTQLCQDEFSFACNIVNAMQEAVKQGELNFGMEEATNILNVVASYEVEKSDDTLYYSNLKITLSPDSCQESQAQSMQLGCLMHVPHESLSYFCLLLDLDNLACLKYHVMDHRILFMKDSYYQLYDICGRLQEVFRPFSLFPPTYVHDISFYVEDDFSESDFMIVVLDILKYLIKSVSLVDVYYDNAIQKYSRCYQFKYQSYNAVLTKEKVNLVHTEIVRKSLQKSLNITLR